MRRSAVYRLCAGPLRKIDGIPILRIRSSILISSVLSELCTTRAVHIVLDVAEIALLRLLSYYFETFFSIALQTILTDRLT